MLSTSNGTKRRNMRSPSIPTEIGIGGPGTTFQPIFLEDSSAAEDSSCHTSSTDNINVNSSSGRRLGISRPSYEAPNQLDFSPILQSRKRAPKVKSALEKYNHASLSHTSPYKRAGDGKENVNEQHQPLLLQTMQAHQNTAPLKSPSKAMTKLTKSKNDLNELKSTSTRTPTKRPFLLSRGGARGSSRGVGVGVDSPSTDGKHKNKSNTNTNNYHKLDGSINLNQSVVSQVVDDNPHHSLAEIKKAFDNDRFFTPAQQSPQEYENLYHSSTISVDSSSSRRSSQYHRSKSKRTPKQKQAWASEQQYNSEVTSTTLSSTTGNGGWSSGVGITPPPKSLTRIIVPYVTPSTDSKSKHKYTVFILLIQPTQKIFELVRINYDPGTSTLQHLLDKIPENTSAEDLSRQIYTGLVRPNASSTSNKLLANLALTASVMARDGSCARIVCGEVLAAIPTGYTGKETQILSRHIMKNPKMVKLLSKKSPHSRKKRSSSSSVSASASVSKDLNTSASTTASSSTRKHNNGKSKVPLGIQGRTNNKSPYPSSEHAGTFSASVLFAPLSKTIDEETGSACRSTNQGKQERERKQKQQEIRASVSLRNVSSSNIVSDDNSCNSSLSSVAFRKNAPSVHQVDTNIELKNKIHNLESTVRNMTNTASPRSYGRKEPIPLVANDDHSHKAVSSEQISLTVNQLEEIKREAAEAARVAARAAAEEAFTKRMEELVSTLNVSPEEKNRLLDTDDMSYHSAMSSAMHAAIAPLTKEPCDFPVSVIINDKPKSPSEVRLLSPIGSYGAYASEVKFVSPYAPAFGSTLLAPKVPFSSPPPPLACVTPHSGDDSSSEVVKAKAFFKPSNTKATDPAITETVCDKEDFEDEIEPSLIAEIMEGFYEVTKKALAKYLSKKNGTRKHNSKDVQRKMQIKIMSIVCILFLTSQSILNGKEIVPDKDIHQGWNFGSSNSLATAQNASYIEQKRNFSLVDLQHIIFWFLVFSKGQTFLSRQRPQRKIRRTWKSRVIPVN